MIVSSFYPINQISLLPGKCVTKVDMYLRVNLVNSQKFQPTEPSLYLFHYLIHTIASSIFTLVPIPK